MAEFTSQEIAARRAEYAAACEAWNVTQAALTEARAAHMQDGDFGPVAAAQRAHAPNAARYDAAFNAMAELPEDEEIEAAEASASAAASQTSMGF